MIHSNCPCARACSRPSIRRRIAGGSFTRHVLAGCAALTVLAAPAARAAEVAYISSSSGYVLGGNGTATTQSWHGQPAMHGFAGYGAIQQNGKCLTGRTGNQPLTWEACKGDAAQKWALSNRRLNNEGGWCADVQGNRAGAGVPVLAFKCSGTANQQWNSHVVLSAREAAAKLVAPQIAPMFIQTATAAQPGQVISRTTGRVISNDGGSLISNDGGGIVSQGGGNVVAQGGGN